MLKSRIYKKMNKIVKEAQSIKDEAQSIKDELKNLKKEYDDLVKKYKNKIVSRKEAQKLGDIIFAKKDKLDKQLEKLESDFKDKKIEAIFTAQALGIK